MKNIAEYNNKLLNEYAKEYFKQLNKTSNVKDKKLKEWNVYENAKFTLFTIYDL